MEKEEAKKLVLEGLQKKSKSKSKFYFNDFFEMLPEMKPREIKKIVNEMVEEQILEYWSSGSTTMYGIKGAGKQTQAEEGE